jgi:hypothetical protein
VPYVIANWTEKICIDNFIFLSETVKILFKEILVTKISGRKVSQYDMYTVFPLKIYCFQECTQRVCTSTSLFNSGKEVELLFVELYTAFLEFNKLSTCANTLYGFFEEIYFQ